MRSALAWSSLAIAEIMPAQPCSRAKEHQHNSDAAKRFQTGTSEVMPPEHFQPKDD
jgi:hypothetical protein